MTLLERLVAELRVSLHEIGDAVLPLVQRGHACCYRGHAYATPAGRAWLETQRRERARPGPRQRRRNLFDGLTSGFTYGD